MKFNKLFILGALSFPFLASCGCSNNTDQKVLDEINAALAEEHDDIDTCYDAVKVIEQHHIEMNDHKFSNQNFEFVYDSKAKQYVIMDGDKIVKKSEGYQASEHTLDYFKSVLTYNPNSKYSQYLDKRAEVPEQLLITTGFDIGAHIDIPNIAYTNLSGEAHDVIVRTYSDYFTVLAPLDTVHHYEIATNVMVTDVATLDEHAETAYIKATKGYIYFAEGSNTLFFEVNEKSGENDVSIDIDKNVEAFSAAINISETKSGDPVVSLPSASVSTVDQLDSALNKQDPTLFIRLANDININLGDGADEHPTIDLEKSVCLDLAGYKLTFDGTDDDEIPIGAMSVTDGNNLYLLDSQGILDDNSGIDLIDSYIYVKGKGAGEGDSSTLMVNGGKISQKLTSAEGVAAIVCNGTTNFSSNFVMYGGKIETKSTVRVPNNVCVTSYGSGSYVNIVYGTLISETSCIAYNNGSEPTGESSTLDIKGGHFTSGTKTPAACIDYGEAVNVNINGGTFTGPTCLSVTSGNVNINGGTFNANGQYRDQYFGADGSVIDIYKGAASKENLNIKIADANMYTNFAYILSAQENAKANVLFHEGVYSNYKGATNILEGADIGVTIDNPENFIHHDI